MVNDVGTTTPPPSTEAGTQGSIGDVGALTYPPIIDVDPINAVPSMLTQDPTADPNQME